MAAARRKGKWGGEPGLLDRREVGAGDRVVGLQATTGHRGVSTLGDLFASPHFQIVTHYNYLFDVWRWLLIHILTILYVG